MQDTNEELIEAGVPGDETGIKDEQAEASLLRAIDWMEGAAIDLRAAMAHRDRHYWGQIIGDGERHEIETVDWWGNRSTTWYRVQLELGPAGFFGWTDSDGEVVVRWSAGKIARQVPQYDVEDAVQRFMWARGSLNGAIRRRRYAKAVEARWSQLLQRRPNVEITA